MAQGENIVKVQFPKEMKVYSPEIDAIKETSQSISNWLHKDLRNIIEPLIVLHAVPDLLKEVNTTVVDQFTNLFQGQVEADVINRQANIKVLNKKIVSSEKHIEQKEENLDKTVERINTRYENLTAQLSKEHEMFLKKLDSHAYDIVDRIYPHQVQDRFSYDSLPGANFLADHAIVSVTDRSECLDNGMKAATKVITSFTEDRKLFNDDLDRFNCSILTEGTYELPFCYIESEDRQTGERKLECWFTCELETGELNKDIEFLREEMVKMAMYLESSQEFFNQSLTEINGYLTDHLPESERQRFMTDLSSK